MVHFFYMSLKSLGQGGVLTTPVRVLLGCGGAVLFFVIGYGYGRGPGLLEAAGNDSLLGHVRVIPSSIADEVDFSLFWQVWALLREKYVDQPISDQDLFYGALQGLVYGLEDPYSTYFTPEMAESFQQELSGSFFGIGAEIGLNADGEIAVIAPLPETPASTAGLVAGDRILAIDGIVTTGMTVNEAVSRIRGEEGTTVVLSILSDGMQEPRDVSITRREIHVDSVKWTVRDDGIGVVTVSMFNEDTFALFAQAADELEKAQVKGIVLDLRNNPGGYLDGALDLAGYWIGTSSAVLEEVRGERSALDAMGDSRFANISTVVLVNGGSASASEILAGALQDYQKAIIIGEQTFGKGSVQEYEDLADGSAIKITVARWLTPNGRSIDKAGITPDQEVTLTLDDIHAKNDPQFSAALNFLTQK